MVNFSKKRLQSLLDSFRGKKILVLGDLMLDRYLWGTVTHISPEAPVPVVEIEEESIRLGGAANVGNNVASLKAIPILVGVIGNDNSGRTLLSIMKENGYLTEGIIVDSTRPTTVKTRVIAHNQHVVRTDRESREDIGEEIQEKIFDILKRYLEQVDAILIEDYNKGLLVQGLIEEVIKVARQKGKIITVDPKFDHFFDFKNVTVFKPNRKEIEAALGKRLRTLEDITRAGHLIQEKLHCRCVVITLGEQGMALFEEDGQVNFLPTKARQVHDVSGAGDTVISTLTLSLVCGANFREACTLANYAAGIVCGQVGIVPITREKLEEEFNNHVFPSQE
ncbi:D-glycero-beta-D-manno-heptose-7-phosphate kinase [candidate division KSB1 bacterium 4484_219]|nr:MAG: D-glycero-beta-D-manno-heptose-7-phosphate kinase [candidate division KSB1 bacterium 4484_219]